MTATNTSPGPMTDASLSDKERKFLRLVRANPHLKAPFFRWTMRLDNGISDEQAWHLLRREIAVAHAKHAGEARS